MPSLTNGPFINKPCSSSAALQAVEDTRNSMTKSQVGRHFCGLGHRWGTSKFFHPMCRFYAVIEQAQTHSICEAQYKGCSNCQKKTLRERKRKERKVEREMKAFTVAQSVLME
jgi:hypothetical protein